MPHARDLRHGGAGSGGPVARHVVGAPMLRPPTSWSEWASVCEVLTVAALGPTAALDQPRGAPITVSGGPQHAPLAPNLPLSIGHYARGRLPLLGAPLTAEHAS